MLVQLLFFPGCPNVDAARVALRDALAAAQLKVKWQEIDVSAEGTDPALRKWGSPTILIDGREINDTNDSGHSCRIYRGERGEIHGAPPSSDILRALRQSVSPKRNGDTP